MSTDPTDKVAGASRPAPDAGMTPELRALLDAPVPPRAPLHVHGSRQRLTAQLFDMLCADFEAHGADAIRACREEQAQGYLRLVASLLPKELDPIDNPLKDIPDAELLNLIEFLRVHVARSPG
jgi:hypothetical protein